MIESTSGKPSNWRYIFPALLLFLIGMTLPNLLAAIQTNTSIRTTGTIKAVGISVYSDSACTTSLTSIDWGVLEGGSVVTRTIYVKNTGNSALTLSLSASNWSPSGASSYIQLSSNYSGQALSSGQSLGVTLTLTVSTSITGITSFSFDIVVIGTG